MCGDVPRQAAREPVELLVRAGSRSRRGRRGDGRITQIGHATPVRVAPSAVGITPATVVGVAPTTIVGIPSISTPGSAPTPGTTAPTTHHVKGAEERLRRERGKGRSAGNDCGQRKALVPGHLLPPHKLVKRGRKQHRQSALKRLLRQHGSRFDINQIFRILPNSYFLAGTELCDAGGPAARPGHLAQQSRHERRHGIGPLRFLDAERFLQTARAAVWDV